MKVAFALLTVCLGVIFAVSACSDAASPEGEEQGKPGFARIVERGLIDCFEAGLQTPEGEPVNCETSAVVYDGTDLIIASDKPIPGENRSPVLAIAYTEGESASDAAAPRYLTASPIVNAIKYEGISITPDGKHIVATTGFDRIKDDSSEWDSYNTLLMWPVGDPDAATIVSASTKNGVTSSVSLREKFSAALKTSQFPEGVPFFKVDGLAVIQGNKLLFGIREIGATFQEFEYVFKIVTVSYEIVSDVLVLADDFELAYEYDPSGRPDVPETVALSGIEFDSHADRFYILTSFEESDTDEGLGGYLWTLPMADFDAKRPPTLVLKADQSPLSFAHKAEGIAVLSKDRVFVVHDDDRVVGRETVENPETQFSRQRHQASYTVVEWTR